MQSDDYELPITTSRGARGLHEVHRMAEIEVRLPDLGEDAGTEARVSFWYVSEGERVEEGDDLVQMLTDKATFDVPSPAAGTVLKRVAEEDQEVKVGQVLCRLKTEE